MNYVDMNFDWLLKEIKQKSERQVFTHIKDKYESLSTEIKDAMEKFINNFNYWGKLNYKEHEYEQIENKSKSLKIHLDDFKWLYNRLSDYRSKKLLFGILYNWYDYDFNTLKELMDNTYCHYFDLDIVECEDETFVDVGAYIGDTTIDFINSYGTNYKKIYCYEMTDDIFSYLIKNTSKYENIECRKKAVSDKSEILKMSFNEASSSANNINKDGNTLVEAISLDEDIKEPITMIKMDIEGYEQKAIEGCRKHIIENHPKLLISVYHNHEDLWKIPKMIEEICPGYKFYLRFYGSNVFPTEIVLFGIYK